MARDSEDSTDNGTSTPTPVKKPERPRERNGGKTTPPPDAPKAEAKKPEPEKAKDEPVSEPKKPKAEPEKEKPKEEPKAEEAKVIPPERTAQDACAEALDVQVKKAKQEKDACWDDRVALDKLVLRLAVMLSTLTPDTKNRYSGLVTEAEEIMTAMKTRSDRIRVFTETIPAKHGVSPGDFTSEETLANTLDRLYGLDSIYDAVALRDELDAHVPDARDKNAHESFVRLANGAIAILQQRKAAEAAKAQAEAEAKAKAAAERQDALRQEEERQARANAPNPFANTSADEAARKRQEDWLRGQQAAAAAPDQAPAPAATANQLAVKATTDELLELVQAYPVRSGALLLAFMIAVYLYF